MARRKEPTESDDKSEANGEPPPSLKRFGNLAKSLLEVPRDQLADAEKRYQRERRRPDES
jgi:hypothetical protein